MQLIETRTDVAWGNLIYHIAADEEWAARTTRYEPAGFAVDGFIHCSTGGQLESVAERFFRGRSSLRLLTIDANRVDGEIRYENLEGGEEPFPHIYRSLNVDAVVEQQRLRVSGDGSMILDTRRHGRPREDVVDD